jgi:hypothetical protein
MCIDRIELFVRIFLISPNLKMHVCWKEVLYKAINNIMIFQKKYILYLAKNTVRYSRRLSTAGTALLFIESGKSTNITVHNLKCVTVMNQDNLQHFTPVPPQHHFHTQDCISQTVRSDLKVAPFPTINLHFRG